ncbi:MAG TPA: hypothetical protein PLH79_07550 [bacterium]|nr:hypothetical protein [Candidatus Omnitrophota bacterium]HOL94184.1 hypothetical protein [bacterium]HPP02128.1 hypothetical protein [bacterium]HXK93980.1 hypothetical protein [bacterium]
MDATETYQFACRCAAAPFTVTVPAPRRTLHLGLGVLTLGVWLVLYALYRIGRLYWISRCPVCSKRSRKLFWILAITLLSTAEFARLLVYFLILAPEQIIADASLAQVPESLDLDSPIHSGNIRQAVGFLWVVAILPTAGALIATYWPYLVLGWLSALTLFGFALPSFYWKKEK